MTGPHQKNDNKGTARSPRRRKVGTTRAAGNPAVLRKNSRPVAFRTRLATGVAFVFADFAKHFLFVFRAAKVEVQDDKAVKLR
jgi:hypothetical protein